MVSPDVVGIGSEYFVVYIRVCIYVRPVYHYIAATVVYLAEGIILVAFYRTCWPTEMVAIVTENHSLVGGDTDTA